MKATLRCHAEISMSVHRGSAAISTIPRTCIAKGLLGWVLGRRVMYRYFRINLPYTMFSKARSLIAEHMVTAGMGTSVRVKITDITEKM